MPEPIPQDFAQRAQLACVAGSAPADTFFELRPFTRDMEPVTAARAFIPIRELNEMVHRIGALAPTHNVFVGAAPRVRKGGTANDVGGVHCLWADLDGPGPLGELAKFRPLPSLFVRTGSPDHGCAYWSLRLAISPDAAQRAARRLARRLGGDKNATDPARILRPVGSLNHKHAPPRAVLCTRLELDVFTVDEVVGALPDCDHYRARAPQAPAKAWESPVRALAGLVKTVAEAPAENRNNTLFWAACRVREHADQGKLDASEARAELRAAAEQTGLPEHEIERTLWSALDRRTA